MKHKILTIWVQPATIASIFDLGMNINNQMSDTVYNKLLGFILNKMENKKQIKFRFINI